MEENDISQKIDLIFRTTSNIISLSVQPLERMNIISEVANFYALNDTAPLHSYIWNPGFGEFRFITCEILAGKDTCKITTFKHETPKLDIIGALEFIISTSEPGLYFVEYTGALLANRDKNNAQLESVIVNLSSELKYSRTSKKVILINLDNLALPVYLMDLIPLVNIPLPNFSVTTKLVSSLISSFDFNHAEITAISTVARGLSTEEIKAAMNYSIVTLESSCLNPKAHIENVLLENKITRLKRLGMQLIESPIVPDVGGLDNLKSIIDKVKIDYSEDARHHKIPLPKGLLLVGPPGTGKTLSANVIAKKLGFPLVIADVGSVVEGGPQFLRELIQRLEAMEQAVAYFDELDKLFTIDSGGEDNNSGRTRAILGTLLTWLQEKRSKIYVIGTLNRLKALPPELTRKGRFDELLYVDFPNAGERRDVIRLHLARFDHRFKKGEDPYTLSEWRNIINNTNKCTSSELAAIVEAAAAHLSRSLLLRGKSAPIEVNPTSLLTERAQITPLFFRDTDRIIALENEARIYCKPASSPDNSVYAPETSSLWGGKK
jgi:ATP-dependent 26S proteasome regulatory subunit